MCVSDSSRCPNPTNGCPWDHPILCNYAPNCVADISECPNEPSAGPDLSIHCASKYTDNIVGCPRGDCATSEAACEPYQDTCLNKMYPNTIKLANELLDENFCYIP